MFSIIWYIKFWIRVFCYFPVYNKVKKLAAQGKMEEHDRITRQIVKEFGQKSIGYAKGEVQLKGMENFPSKPVVYVANHRSYFDIPLILGYLGDEAIPIVAKYELQSMPIISKWMKELNCVFLNRKDPREAIKNINQAIKLVKSGNSMVVFPEGTRSKDENLLEFKSGAFRIAEKAKVNVVPLCIFNTATMMGTKGLKISSGKIALKILPQIDTSSYTKDDWKNLPELCENLIREGLKEL